jgi:hypothetical protein
MEFSHSVGIHSSIFTLPEGGSEMSLNEFAGRAMRVPSNHPLAPPDGSFLAVDPPGGRVKCLPTPNLGTNHK